MEQINNRVLTLPNLDSDPKTQGAIGVLDAIWDSRPAGKGEPQFLGSVNMLSFHEKINWLDVVLRTESDITSLHNNYAMITITLLVEMFMISIIKYTFTCYHYVNFLIKLVINILAQVDIICVLLLFLNKNVKLDQFTIGFPAIMPLI